MIEKRQRRDQPMNTSSNPEFTRSVAIQASPEKIWEALTHPDLVQQYHLAPLFLIEEHENGQLLYGTGEQLLIWGKITQWEPFSRLGHTFSFDPETHRRIDADPETFVSYKIEPRETDTLLTVHHWGFPGENQTYANICGGWPYILDGLKQTAESLPKTPDVLIHGPVELQFKKLTPADPLRGFVPYFHFQITAGGAEVGHINLRVGHTDHVRFYAGHVGFEVIPIHRGNRYAFHACLALAPLARSVLPELVFTCDPDNHASRRTIELIGASFIDEVPVPPEDPHYAHGSRSKQRFLWIP